MKRKRFSSYQSYNSKNNEFGVSKIIKQLGKKGRNDGRMIEGSRLNHA